MSALAQAYANTGDPAYQTKGNYLVSALATCQAAATSRGFHAGYLSAYRRTSSTGWRAASRSGPRTTRSTRSWPACSDQYLLAATARR